MGVGEVHLPTERVILSQCHRLRQVKQCLLPVCGSKENTHRHSWNVIYTRYRIVRCGFVVCYSFIVYQVILKSNYPQSLIQRNNTCVIWTKYVYVLSRAEFWERFECMI